MKVFQDFNKDIFKNNISIIVTMTIIVLCLILIDILPKITEKEITGLEDKSININALVINEIMTSNKGAFADANGNCYDWIELYNGTNKDIDLTGYTLSDEDSGKTKWIFPSTTINHNSYLIVYLSGNNNKGLYANFALDKTGGETITLKKRSGKVVDAVKVEQLEKNNVMARNSDGKWFETGDITPGYSNNVDGRNDYLKKLKGLDDTLVITEFLPSNKGNISFDGNFYGYIEIKNVSSEKVNLGNYSVSNDINRPFQYKLPNISLEGNETYLIYTSGKEYDNHTNFVLNKKTGTVILSKNNKIVEQVDYQNLTNGFAYIKEGETFHEGTVISPGYDNTTDGVKEFSKTLKMPESLVINEVMTSNSKYMIHNGGQAYNWIELYNNSRETIDLKDYYLTTDDNNKTMYQLPDKMLYKGEYFVIMASGDTSLSTNYYHHANFKLSDVESLYLYNSNGTIVDSMFIANIPINYSYGRANNGLYYYEKPTPDSKNDGAKVLQIAYTPTFATKPGVYNNQENLAVKINGTGEIYYTLDGSVPTTKSLKYDGEIDLNKTTVIRAISYEPDKKDSEILTGTYLLNENHTLPVMSISLQPDEFTNIEENSEENIIKRAHTELYEKNKSFSIDCGFKLFGSATRLLDKKSFALKFSTRYGPSKLEYKIFDNRETTTFDTLVIRSGSQDYVNSMIRDELGTSVMDEFGTIDVQAYKPVVLYLNGEYYGIYFLREKIEEEFIASHYNVPEDNINIITMDDYTDAGTNKDYLQLKEYAFANDLRNDKNYSYVASKLDIDNFIDFWIAEGFVSNSDLLNVRFFNSPYVDNGKFKMIFYDLDYGFYNRYEDYLTFLMNYTYPINDNMQQEDNIIFQKLFMNEKFRSRYLERFEWNMQNVWTEENILKKYNELVNLLKPEMKRNMERWGLKYEDWEKNCLTIERFIKRRVEEYPKVTYQYIKNNAHIE